MLVGLRDWLTRRRDATIPCRVRPCRTLRGFPGCGMRDWVV